MFLISLLFPPYMFQVFKVIMIQENDSHIHESILLGFSTIIELQALLFVIFLIMYLLTVLENSHHHFNQKTSPTPQAHVLFLRPSIFPRGLVPLSHCSQIAGQLSGEE